MRLIPNDAAALAFRGNACFLMSQFDKAARDFNQATRLESTHGLAYNTRACFRATRPRASMPGRKDAVVRDVWTLEPRHTIPVPAGL